MCIRDRDQRKYVEEMENIKDENEALRKENMDNKELAEVRNTVEYLEKDRSKYNGIISGLKIDADNETGIKNNVENFIGQYLEVNMQTSEVYKIGGKNVGS